jgi:hypothetical protein
VPDGGVALLPAAIPEGFSGEPTPLGVAPCVDENGLVRQNAQLLPLPLEQPDRATRVDTANAQHVTFVRMVSVLRSQEKIERSQIKIERFRAFDYSFPANFAGYAENSTNRRALSPRQGHTQGKLGRIIDTLPGGSMAD